MDHHKHVVEPQYLAELIVCNKTDHFLVVDCRSFLDYSVSHIKTSINCFYSKLIRRRILNSKTCNVESSVYNHLSHSVGNQFLRGFDQITLILYGNGCESEKRNSRYSSSPSACSLSNRFALQRSASDETSTKSEPNTFLDELVERLQDAKTFTNVFLLKGGFNEFRQSFPELCESNATLNTPQTPCSNSQPTTFNDIRCEPKAKMSCSVSQPMLNNRVSGDDNVDAPITQVLDFFFLGSQQDAQNPTILKKFGITRVINLSDAPKSDLIEPDNFLRIPIRDSHDAKILPHFDEAFEFIEEARRTNQKILVHCLAGISRSPTLCIAYIMRSKGWTCDKAYKFVKSRRPSVSPNLNFVGQLFLYEEHLRKQEILPPCIRPRSNVIDDFDFDSSTNKEQAQTAAPRPVQPLLVNEKLCKSASADFSVLSNEPMADSRKRIMDTPLSLPCRPRQLMNCCARKKFDDAPPSLPSPSTEFSKLDISLSNPCFGTPSPIASEHQVQPQTSAQINVENLVFDLMSNEERSKTADSKPTSNKKHATRHHLFNLFTRRHGDCKLVSANRMRCKVRQRFQNSPLVEENTQPVYEGVRFRSNHQRFGHLPTRTPISIMPTLPDDDSVDSGKGTSISHSVSTEDGDVQEP
ncbi:Protein-tyrosine-phosphatase [Aphelenchoides bicaudatus]|nr:Protein-tyrosine-phosphatase [Aphelenchoides bicaudatus]